LSTNFIRLEIDPKKSLCQHLVTFEPPVDDRRLCFKLVRSLENVTGPTRSFDGRTLVLPHKVDTLQSVPCPQNPGKVYAVRITYQKTNDWMSQECIHHFNVLFNRIMQTLKFKRIRDSFYDPLLAVRDPAAKLEIWPGFVTAVNPVGDDGGDICLQLDVSHKVLQETTVRQLMNDVYMACTSRGKAPATSSIQNEIFKAVVDQVVMTRYNNMTYRVDEIDFNSNPETTFDCRGVSVSFVDYYREHYGLEIVDRKQPLLVSRKNMKGNVNAPQIKLYLIPELCYLTGLTQGQRDDFKVMKSVANQTNVGPEEREHRKRQLIKRIKEDPEAYRVLLDWGISLPDDSIQLEGRVSEMQPLLFGGNRMEAMQANESSADGCILKAVRQHQMFRSVELRCWTLIFVGGSEGAVHALRRSLERCHEKLGMSVCPPQRMVALPNDRADSYVRAIRETLDRDTNREHQLIVTVVPSKREDRYAAIKNECYVRYGINNQVVQSKTLQRKGAESIIQNIAIQINAKLGGQPWASKELFRNCMVVGIDVSHDPTMRKKSAAVLVATMNKHFSEYFSVCENQTAHTELMDSLEACFLKALIEYTKRNGTPPDRVVVYRDGVGDGRLNYTLEYEVPQIQSAFAKFSPTYDPKLSFVVVSKRVMARFTQPTHRGGYVNPPMGTVVDHTVTKRYPKGFLNFYLVSQKALQGTVSPTHYVLLYDNSDIKPDQIQKLSYRLTYMYYNSKETVRVPSPCLYADRLAGMVNKNLKSLPNPRLSQTLFYL